MTKYRGQTVKILSLPDHHGVRSLMPTDTSFWQSVILLVGGFKADFFVCWAFSLFILTICIQETRLKWLQEGIETKCINVICKNTIFHMNSKRLWKVLVILCILSSSALDPSKDDRNYSCWLWLPQMWSTMTSTSFSGGVNQFIRHLQPFFSLSRHLILPRSKNFQPDNYRKNSCFAYYFGPVWS